MFHAGDRNLLVGVFAIQLGFIDATGFVDASRSWIESKGKPLVDVLVEKGWITSDDRKLINQLVDRHIELTGSVDGSLEEITKHLPPSGFVSEVSLEELKKVLPESWLDTIDRMATPPTDVPNPQKESAPKQRYRIVRDLARGGLGKVSVAHDDELDREVALKEIQPRHAGRRESQQRFLTEARVTGSLEHPGVVPIYSLGNFRDGRPYYAMRLIRGKNLAVRIKQDRISELKRRPYEQAIRPLINHLIDVCNTVAYAHSRSVLHRDIKPANIMLGKYGETLLVDWGLAKASEETAADPMQSELPLADKVESGSQPTELGSVIGTPSYMSPEQAAGRVEQIDHRSDIFSLGATLHQILTGSAPYEGSSREDIIDRARKCAIKPLRESQPSVPRELNAICMKAMSKDRDHRYQSAKEMADDLERWSAGEPVIALPENAARTTLRWTRRHQPALISGLAMSLLGLAGMTFLYGEANRAQRETNQALQSAQRSRQMASSVIDDFVNKLADEEITQVEALDDKRVSILESVYRKIEEQIDQHPEDMQFQWHKLNVLLRLGNYLKNVGSHRKDPALVQHARDLLEQIPGIVESAIVSADRPLEISKDNWLGCDVDGNYLLSCVEAELVELKDDPTDADAAECLKSCERGRLLATEYFGREDKSPGAAMAIARLQNVKGQVLIKTQNYAIAQMQLAESLEILKPHLQASERGGLFVGEEVITWRNVLILAVQARVLLATALILQGKMEQAAPLLERASTENKLLMEIDSGVRDGQSFQSQIDALLDQVHSGQTN